MNNLLLLILYYLQKLVKDHNEELTVCEYEQVQVALYQIKEVLKGRGFN